MPDMRQAVDDAVAAMDWLKPSDMAMVATARALADQIEDAAKMVDDFAVLAQDLHDAGEDALLKRLRGIEKRADLQKVVGWYAPLLQGILRDLAGAPLARKLMAEQQAPGDRMAALRSMATDTKAGR